MKMFPRFEAEGVVVYAGDNREVLKLLPDNSVDAVVTDPPYGLSDRTPDAKLVREVMKAWIAGRDIEVGGAGFMGKAWDAFVPGPEVWRECYRVLKPGGHLVAFFGTRTYDLGALAIRLAGFEARDMLAWLYGTGFPKSFDVSKGIDKLDAVTVRRERALQFTAWMRSTRIASATIARVTGTAMASHYLTDREQPAVATRDHLEAMRPHLGEVPPWVEQLVDERTVESVNFKARHVVGKHEQEAQAARWRSDYVGTSVAPAGDITVAHTAEAQAWEGWGTALKPALEPVFFGRKPLVGTVAENVLKHGTGGLNIDACRIETDGETFHAPQSDPANRTGVVGSAMQAPGGANRNQAAQRASTERLADLGRWPANVILDGSPEVEELFPGGLKSGVPGVKRSGNTGAAYGAESRPPGTQMGGFGDEGSAARFFYSAKADAGDRLGSDHPTVKPGDLMAWLCKLVTPPGGVVLDPFAGTGSTGLAAQREGFSAILVEREPKHVEDIRLRLEHAAGRAPHTKALKARNKPKPPPSDLFGDEA